MTILIKNGRVINPSEKMDKVLDVYVKDGVIVEKGENIEKEADKVIDAKGCFVMPGLIDLHVHFRDPGLTYKEDIIMVDLHLYVACQIQNLLLTMQKWSDIL